MPQALSELRVLDLSRVVAAPWASQILADLGAEVIKIERPGRGDDTRAWGPPFLRDRNGRETADAAYFLGLNRGKKSVTVDLADPAGQALVRRLAAQSDVLIENYRVGTLERYGLGYEALRTDNPGLVYCSVTGFGQTGPYRDRAGYDFVVQGLGGLMSVTGEPPGLPGGGPQKVGVPIADLMTGMYAAVAILAALNYRQRSGVGQRIDLALLDTQVAAMTTAHLNYLVSGEVLGSYGNASASIVPYQVFASADRPLILAIGNDSQFVAFCDLAGRPELAADPRFASNAGRVRHRALLVPLVGEILRARTCHEWLAVLEAAGVPAGPINDLAEVFADPQVRERQMHLDLPHPVAGSVPSVASPLRLSETPVAYDRAPPTLGQHTAEVLRERLGVSDGELAALAARGVI